MAQHPAMRLRTSRTLGNSDGRASGQPLAMRWVRPETLAVVARLPSGFALDHWSVPSPEGDREVAPGTVARRTVDMGWITAAVDEGDGQVVVLEEEEKRVTLALWDVDPLRCVARSELALEPHRTPRLAVRQGVALVSDGSRTMRVDLRKGEVSELDAGSLQAPGESRRSHRIDAIVATPDGFALANGEFIGVLRAEGGAPIWIRVGRGVGALTVLNDASIAGVGNYGTARVSLEGGAPEVAAVPRTWPWVDQVVGQDDLLIAVVGNSAVAIDLGAGWFAPLDGRATACRVALDPQGRRLAVAYDLNPALMLRGGYAVRVMRTPRTGPAPGQDREPAGYVSVTGVGRVPVLTEREGPAAGGPLELALGHTGPLCQLAYGPAGEVYSIGSDGGPLRWEAAGAVASICPAPHRRDQNTVAVATATGDLWFGDSRGLWVRQGETWSERPVPWTSRAARDSLFYVKRVCVSADGTSALVCSAVECRGYMRVELWRRGGPFWSCERHLGIALRGDQVTLSPDGRYALTRTDFGTYAVDLTSFSTPPRSQRLDLDEDSLDEDSEEFDEDEEDHDEDEEDEEDEEELGDARRKLWLPETHGLAGTAISPDSRWAVLQMPGPKLTLVDLASMQVQEERAGASVHAATFVSAELLVTAGQRPPRLHLWRIPELACVAEIALEAEPCAVAADPTRGSVAVGLADGLIVEFLLD